MLVKKKQILTATLIIALTAAVAVNWYYSRSSVGISDASSTTSEEYVSGNLGDSLLVAGSVQSEEDTSVSDETDETDAVETAGSSSETYFAEARLKRTNMHDEASEKIEDMIENENLSQEEKSQITTLLTEFQQNIKQETDTENLITAKTGGECLVIISDQTAQVILQQGTLNDTVLIQITDIFEKNTGISAENLTIIEAK